MAENPPSEKVFVGDVPVGATEETLRDVFGGYGIVTDVKLLPPRIPGTKGAALVRFESVDTAKWLVENVNGNIPQGMSEPVYVTFAKSGKSWGGEGGGYGDGGGYGKAPGAFNSPASGPYDGGASAVSSYSGASPLPSEKLFIGDVPVGMDEETFKQVMGKYGNVVDVKLLPARAPGEKGSALLRYATVEEAQWVVENMNGSIPEGLAEALYICFARNPGRGYAGGGAGGAGAGGSAAQAPAAGGNPAATLAAALSSLGPFAAALQGTRGSSNGGRTSSLGAVAAALNAAAAAAANSKVVQPPLRAPAGGKSGKGKGGNWGPSSNDAHEVIRGILRSGKLPGSGRKPDANTIQVTNLPANTADLDLYKLFSPFGAVAVNGVKAMLNEDGSCRGIGFVDYVDSASVTLAIETLHDTELPDGSRLGVQLRPPSRPKWNGS